MKALIGAIGAAVFWIGGMLYERGALMLFKGQEQGAASAQNAGAKGADKQNEGDFHASASEVQNDIQAVHDYYAANPVTRVRIVNGSCVMPKTTDNPKGGDGSSASMYVSACSPEEQGLAAARLYDLQQRLLMGVRSGSVVIQ